MFSLAVIVQLDQSIGVLTENNYHKNELEVI
jgi:hypothetical protein